VGSTGPRRRLVVVSSSAGFRATSAGPRAASAGFRAAGREKTVVDDAVLDDVLGDGVLGDAVLDDGALGDGALGGERRAGGGFGLSPPSSGGGLPGPLPGRCRGREKTGCDASDSTGDDARPFSPLVAPSPLVASAFAPVSGAASGPLAASLITLTHRVVSAHYPSRQLRQGSRRPLTAVWRGAPGALTRPGTFTSGPRPPGRASSGKQPDSLLTWDDAKAGHPPHARRPRPPAARRADGGEFPTIHGGIRTRARRCWPHPGSARPLQ